MIDFTEKPEAFINPDKIINILCIVFGGLFVFQIYKEFGMISFMFTDSHAKWDFSMVIYFFPFLIIPTATILFYLRKKLGWRLLAIFLTYSVVNFAGQFILTLDTQQSNIPALDNIFPQTSPTTYILQIVFFAGILWTICKEEIRQIYKVEKKSMFKTIGVIVILTIWALFAILM